MAIKPWMTWIASPELGPDVQTPEPHGQAYIRKNKAPHSRAGLTVAEGHRGDGG